MKSGGAHVSTACYLNPGLLYTMHTLQTEKVRERLLCLLFEDFTRKCRDYHNIVRGTDTICPAV